MMVWLTTNTISNRIRYRHRTSYAFHNNDISVFIVTVVTVLYLRYAIEIRVISLQQNTSQ